MTPNHYLPKSNQHLLQNYKYIAINSSLQCQNQVSLTTLQADHDILKVTS